MRRLLFAAAAACCLVVPLTAATGAQAAVPATTVASCNNNGGIALGFTDHGTPSRPYGYQNSSGDLAFSSSLQGSYCFYVDYVSSNGTFVWDIWPFSTGKCLDMSGGLIGESPGSTCNSGTDQDGPTQDQWLLNAVATIGNDTWFAVQNNGTGDCIYDDAQDPAIAAGCGKELTDHFLWVLYTTPMNAV
jgi:hypothetical protein